MTTQDAVEDPLPTGDTGYLNPEQVAKLLGSERITVMKLTDAGRLRSVNIGTGERKFRRTTAAWVAEFLTASGTDATENRRAA